MNFSELKSALGIEDSKLENNTITINRNTLTDNINDIINYCYGNTPVVINNAQFIKEDPTTSSVFLKGTSNFLEVPDLEFNAQFSVDKSNLVQIFFKYTVLDNNPGPAKWTFSRSFPQLPAIVDNTKPVIYNRIKRTFDQPTIVALDQLVLFNSYFVVVSNPQTEPEFQVQLDWGINFVGNIRPKGFIGVIETLFENKNTLTIYGTIRKPLPTETPDNLALKYPVSPEKFQFPWSIVKDFPKGVPGILLKVKLDLNYQVNDTIEFQADELIIYSPVSSDWALYNTNPGFFPMQAYTGRILLDKAGLSMDMISPIDYGIDEFQLIGIFKGFILKDLAQLAGLTGSSDSPLSLLPDEIKKLGSSLGKLELMSASISIDYSDIKSLSVSNASFTAGMPELNWNVWKDDSNNGKTRFEIDSIACSFNFDYPFSVSKEEIYGRKVGVMVYGNLKIENVPFTVYAGYDDGFAVYAEMTQGQTIPLNNILTTYAPGIPAPSDLTINVFKVSIFPGQFYSMALTLASKPTPWVIPLGPKDLIVEDVAMGFTYNQGGSATGTVSGIIKLPDNIQLEISYNTPGDIAIHSFLPSVSLKQIVDTLTNQTLEIPEAFHLSFINNSVLIQKQAGNYVFQMAADMEELGLVALQVQKITSVWGIAVGIDMTDIRPSSLSGLGFLDAFEKMFQMHKFMLVVSSFDGVQFQFPDMASFNNPALAAKNISLPAQATTLVAGLNIYANWTINTSDKQQNLLLKFLGINPTLGVTLQVSKNPEQFSKLFVSYKTQIQGHPFGCQFGGQIRDGQLGLFLTGTLQAEIQRQLTRFDVTLLFVANGAFISGSMLGSITFEGLTLSNLALVIGVNWEGVPSLGIAATLAVSRFQSSLAVFFDSTDPSRSMLAGAVSDLSLKDVVETFAGSVSQSEVDEVLPTVRLVGTGEFTISTELANALDNMQIDAISAAFSKHGVLLPAISSQVLLVVTRAGESWFLTNMVNMLHYQLSKTADGINVKLEPQLYVVPNTTFIGAMRFDQGIFLDAGLEILTFSAAAKILVRQGQGISVDGRMDRIIIGTEALFSVESVDKTGGPIISAATFNQPDMKEPSLRSPHFLIDGNLNILGLRRQAYVSLSSKGLIFDISGTMPPSFDYDLHGHVDDPKNMGIGGSLRIGIGIVDLGQLGKVNIQTGAAGAPDIGVRDVDIWAKFNGSIEFAGEKLILPTVNLDVNAPSLLDLPKKLVALVTEALNNFLKGNPVKWASLVRNGIITGVDNVGNALKVAYKATAEQAAQWLKGAGYEANQSAQILRDAGYAANEVGNALNTAYGSTAEQIAQWLKGAGYAVNEVGSYVKDAFNLGPDQLNKVLLNAGFPTDQIKGFFQSLGGAFSNLFSDIGKKLDPRKW